MSEHLVTEITQKAIISDNNKIILTRDIDDPNWELPGGRLHNDEKPADGLEREINEEIGLKVAVKSVFATDVATTPKGETRFMVVYICDFINNLKEIKLKEDEIAEYKWVGKDDWQRLSLYSEFVPVLEEYFSKTQ